MNIYARPEGSSFMVTTEQKGGRSHIGTYAIPNKFIIHAYPGIPKLILKVWALLFIWDQKNPFGDYQFDNPFSVRFGKHNHEQIYQHLAYAFSDPDENILKFKNPDLEIKIISIQSVSEADAKGDMSVSISRNSDLIRGFSEKLKALDAINNRPKLHPIRNPLINHLIGFVIFKEQLGEKYETAWIEQFVELVEYVTSANPDKK